MATFAADSATLNHLSDLHHRIAQYYQKAHDQIITHGNDITHELRHAERYDAMMHSTNINNGKIHSLICSMNPIRIKPGQVTVFGL